MYQLNEQLINDAETFGNSITAEMRDRQKHNLEIDRHIKQEQAEALELQLKEGVEQGGVTVATTTTKTTSKSGVIPEEVMRKTGADFKKTAEEFVSPFQRTSSTFKDINDQAKDAQKYMPMPFHKTADAFKDMSDQAKFA